MHANLKHKGDKIHSEEYNKTIYNTNNARNRCIMTRSKASGRLTSLDDVKDDSNEEEVDMELKILDDIDNTNSNTDNKRKNT